MKIITRPILLLSIVSLLNDISSEMIIPIMPIYLKTIGFSVLFIGILEGVAEATAGLSKSYFGNLSDRMGQRAPFVKFGYLLSAISKTMLAALTYPLWIFFSRTMDRLGKGIRTAARDALLADESTPATRGRVFGFHRTMDTLGALVGPIIALVFLHFVPGEYRMLFLIAFIPGILAVVVTLFIREHRSPPRNVELISGSSLMYWKRAPRDYVKLLIGLLLFAILNSSDAFLILMLKRNGLSDTHAILVYIFYNLIFALASYPAGSLGDRFGLKTMFIIGLVIFSGVYLCMAFAHDYTLFFVILFAYGIYAACSEGISKAWVSNLVDQSERATAIGNLAAYQSICTMIASALAGWIWVAISPAAVFIFSGVGCLILAVYFVFFVPRTVNVA